jgi:hypothetical protein
MWFIFLIPTCGTTNDNLLFRIFNDNFKFMVTGIKIWSISPHHIVSYYLIVAISCKLTFSNNIPNVKCIPQICNCVYFRLRTLSKTVNKLTDAQSGNTESNTGQSNNLPTKQISSINAETSECVHFLIYQ